MGLFSHAGSTIKSFTSPTAAPRTSNDEERPLSDTEADDTSILYVLFCYSAKWRTDTVADSDEDEGSIIASLISQLRRVYGPFMSHANSLTSCV